MIPHAKCCKYSHFDSLTCAMATQTRGIYIITEKKIENFFMKK